GNSSGLFSNTVNTGDAGKLSVSVPLLQLDGVRISSNTFAAGNAGNLDLQVRQLTLARGATISAGVGTRLIKDGLFVFIGTDSTGHGGNLTIDATESISIAGEKSAGVATYTTGIGAGTNGKGDAGTLSVSTPTLLLTDEAFITAGTLGDGNGGNLDVQVGKLTLLNGSIMSSAIGTRQPGAPIVYGTGGPGRGGNLTIHATESISLSGQTSQGQPSAIGTTSLKGSGDAGNVFISTPELRLTGGALGSDTWDKGNGGDIRLEVGRLTADVGGIVSFTAGDGNAGDIEVQVGTLTLS